VPSSPSATSALRALASGAPVLFTAAWLLLGGLSDGYSQRGGTISELAEQGAVTAGAMTTALAVLGVGQLAGWVLAWQRPRAPAVGWSLVLAGAGTLAVAALPLPGAAGPRWLTSAHALAATAAFGGLHLAALSGSLSGALPRRLRVAGAAALAVALPHLVGFVSGLDGPGRWSGYLEKAFTTVLLAWCAALAWRPDVRASGRSGTWQSTQQGTQPGTQPGTAPGRRPRDGPSRGRTGTPAT
jgi:hypothetical protein